MQVTATPATPAAPPAPARPAAVDLSGEDGAQAVEYAMIGGLGAGLIGLLWTVISRTGLVDKLTKAVVGSALELVRSWF